jgi:hypothetical protein
MPKPARIVMHGGDGVGKSSFWAQAPAPVFICTEDGATRIAVPKFPLCTDWQMFTDCLRALGREAHEFKTLVIDSADWAQELMIRHVVARDFQADGDTYEQALAKFNDYGRGWRPSLAEWMKFLQALDWLREKKGMEIALICHSAVIERKNPTGDNYQVFQPNLHHSDKISILNKTREWADLVLFAQFGLIVNSAGAKKADDKPKVGKAVGLKGEKARLIYAGSNPAFDAKVRAGWKLPDSMPLDQAKFRQHLANNAPEEPENDKTQEGAQE